MQLKVTDVERIKKQVRKLAAGRVLSGSRTDVCLDLASTGSFRAQIAAAYGPLSRTPLVTERDRLIWILEGFAEIHDAAGRVANVSQGESAVLRSGEAYRLVFPQLTLYLSVEEAEKG